jgi:methionine biosynthesis protein metW
MLNSIRNICKERLTRPPQDIDKSNQMWNKRAKELSLLAERDDADGYIEFFKQHVDLNGTTVIDLGCGAGRYLKLLMDEGALVEGLEPSEEMIKYAKKHIKDSGYNEEDVNIYNVAFQDFEPEKQYDYVFISNSPIVGYYESYEKILKLAKKGIFIGEWIERKDLFFEKLVRSMGKEVKRQLMFDIYYYFNLFAADGYLPNFKSSIKISKEELKVEKCIQRYTSWIYGEGYTDNDMKLVMDEILKYKSDKEELIVEFHGIRGMIYVDKEVYI